MKYQEGLDETKEWLRDHSKAEVLLVLQEAGLSEQKCKIVLSKFCQEQRRDPASYDLAMHPTTYSKKLTLALRKVRATLIWLGLVDR